MLNVPKDRPVERRTGSPRGTKAYACGTLILTGVPPTLTYQCNSYCGSICGSVVYNNVILRIKCKIGDVGASGVHCGAWEGAPVVGSTPAPRSARTPQRVRVVTKIFLYF